MLPADPLSTWDRESLRAVALAYRRQRQAGESDLPARMAAEAAYRDLHPDTPERWVSVTVARIIASVAREHPAWFWRGVGEPRR
jgi:hypothetical protein